MALTPDLQSTVCCWRGCDATFEGKDKPEGWVSTHMGVATIGPGPYHWRKYGVACVIRATELARSLRDPGSA